MPTDLKQRVTVNQQADANDIKWLYWVLSAFSKATHSRLMIDILAHQGD